MHNVLHGASPGLTLTLTTVSPFDQMGARQPFRSCAKQKAEVSAQNACEQRLARLQTHRRKYNCDDTDTV
jgi:hypothetical protein